MIDNRMVVKFLAAMINHFLLGFFGGLGAYLAIRLLGACL